MDILTKDLPFKVEFVVYRSEKEIKQIIQLPKFSLNADVGFIEDLNLLEYDSLSVRFLSDKGEQDNNKTKLYMDCFEYIDEIQEPIEIDESGFEYITPNNETMIHRHFNNDVGYPLIPGIYKIKVYWNGKDYYSQILIKPNNLEIIEHNQMIREIESHAKGLARDWIKKNNSIDILKDVNSIDPTFIDLAAILIKREKIIKKAMHVILNRPFTKLEKSYAIVSVTKSRKMDNKSLRLSQIKNSSSLYNLRSFNDGEIYSYTMTDNYSNNVNYYLIKIINDFQRILKMASVSTVELKKYLELELIQLKRYKKEYSVGDHIKISSREKQLLKVGEFEKSIDLLNRMLINSINSSFLKNIKVPQKIILSQQLIKTPGYNIFYRVHKLINGGLDNQIEDMYDYTWKSSEVLYEYWCFIKIIEMLKELEYEPESGWIFNLSSEEHKISIPAIPDNTFVVFEKENIVLKLIFNSAMGKSPEKADKLNSPYWTRSNRNKPDFRLDIYKDKIFMKTIILDSKYSPANRVWNKKYVNSASPSKVVEQFKMYVNMVIKVNTRNEHVVDEVIALCPTNIENNKILEHDYNHLVTIATLKPGMKNDFLCERLEKLIVGII